MTGQVAVWVYENDGLRNYQKPIDGPRHSWSFPCHLKVRKRKRRKDKDAKDNGKDDPKDADKDAAGGKDGEDAEEDGEYADGSQVLTARSHTAHALRTPHTAHTPAARSSVALTAHSALQHTLTSYHASQEWRADDVNDTPLKWVRVDPMYCWIRELRMRQPSFMWTEQLLIDSDTAGQVGWGGVWGRGHCRAHVTSRGRGEACAECMACIEPPSHRATEPCPQPLTSSRPLLPSHPPALLLFCSRLSGGGCAGADLPPVPERARHPERRADLAQWPRLAQCLPARRHDAGRPLHSPQRARPVRAS